MDERDRRLIALKDSVKSFFEVTGVGASRWESGFETVRKHDEMAESFVTEMRRLLMFIEEEYELADRPAPSSVPLRPPASRPAAGSETLRPLAPSQPRPSASTTRPGIATTRPAAPGAPSRPAAAPAAAPARPAPAASRGPLNVPGTSTSPDNRPKHPAAADVPEDPTERVSVPTFTPPKRRK